MKVTSRVALVTGATRGIGRGIASRLAAEGADIIINYHKNEKAAVELRDKITSIGKRALIVKADISSEVEVKRMFEEISRDFQKLDILINNAGIERLCLLADMPSDQWDEVLNTNLRGAFLCCKYAVPLLAKNGNGRIINVASDAGKTGYKYLSAYCASKFGLIGLTQSLAAELAEHRITVNAICPGATYTDMLDWEYVELAKLQGTTAIIEQKALLDRIPLRRIASPEEIGSLIVFLSSDDGSFVTGESINISGGMEVH